jgi:predicted GNAT family acetyltransferase
MENETIEFKLEEFDTNGRLVAKDKEGKEMGEMTFSIANEGQLWIVDHTGVNEAYKGQGVAKELFFRLIEIVRASDRKIIPLCPFTRRMLEKHTDMHDVLRHGSL